jgi:hypothetical protein
MDYGAIITESIDYTREALWGRWVRWLILIICGLPFALFPFVFDVTKIISGTTIHWELVRWDQVAAILIAGFLLSFIISGYMVRIYRGITPAPGFENGGTLFLDGIKLAVVRFLWFIPMLLVVAVLLAIVVFSMTGGNTGSTGLLIGLVFLTILAEFVLGIIAVLYSIPGAVRFARTGSIREGIRFSKITETLRTIGWGTYIIALIVLFIVGIVFFVITAILSFIPYAGWILVLVITPLYSVFSARYISRVYDHGESQPAVP